MKYNSALPYFFEEDIQDILAKFGDILRGKGLLSMGRNVKEFEKQFSRYLNLHWPNSGLKTPDHLMGRNNIVLCAGLTL